VSHLFWRPPHYCVDFITDRPVHRDSKAGKPSPKACQPYYFCAIPFLINMGRHSRKNNRAEDPVVPALKSVAQNSDFAPAWRPADDYGHIIDQVFDVPRDKIDKLTAVCISSHLSNEPCFSPFVDFDKAGSNITGSFRKEYQSKHLMGRTTSQA
jgi:hypothetical protein